MVECGESVEARKPQDRVAEPCVYRRDRCAHVVGKDQERRDLYTGEKRQRMALQPRTADRGQWKRKK